MPTYEYRCTKCGHQFERDQGIKEKPLKRCPKCAGKIRRVITGGSGFVFKGGAPTPTHSGQSARGASCCGTSTPCDDPKRCCGQ